MKIIIDSYNQGYEDAKCNHINDSLNFAQEYLYNKGLQHYPVLISDIKGFRLTSLEWLANAVNREEVYMKCMEKIKTDNIHPRVIVDMVIDIIENQ
jgi:Golgi nucleoside diphosphatase